MARKILIVGGVAGGASFAARMRRLDEDAKIILFEKGEYISFANCGLPYHIGGTIVEREKLLVQTPEGFTARFAIDIRVQSEVISVNSSDKTVEVRSKDGTTYTESFDVLLLSPGATPLRPPIPGIDHPKIRTLRTIPDTDTIKGMVDRGGVKHAVVIGGGFIGLEMAENLRHRGISVTLVELSNQVFIPADVEMADILHQHITMNGVELVLEDGASEFVSSGDQVAVILKSGRKIQTDLIILAIGVKPDTSFLKGSGVELSDRGAIIVSDRMETNIPSIYAVGDAVEVTDFVSGTKVLIPLAGPANRQGRIAADTVAGINSTYKATQGTAICKLFDLTGAVTGINERTALRLNIPYLKSYTHSASHASYYPGAFQMSLKILFAPDTGKLLGAQIIGKEGVDKRIDVFATALRHGLTISELTELELAYAPPYSSAKDPVNMAGFVAENILTGRMPVVYGEEINAAVRSSLQLIDVRSAEEYANGTIEGALNIPVDTLRNRLNELDSSREVILFCQVGLRGYVAARILIQNGFTVRNLSGGYKTWTHQFSRGYDAAVTTPVRAGGCSSPERDDRPVVSKLDACGLQCPGPIMKLKHGVDALADGETLLITATDSGFSMDLPVWCSRTGNTLVSLNHEKGIFTAKVKKGRSGDSCAVTEKSENSKTMVMFSSDFDKAMAALIIANGAVSMGSEVTLFFTFWGLNILRKKEDVPVKKSFIEMLFGKMMPRGISKIPLSKMNMGGIGKFLMLGEMKKKKVMSIEELLLEAQKAGVHLVACTMSMDIMGIKKEELIDGIEYGGVAAYLGRAEQSNYNIFV